MDGFPLSYGWSITQNILLPGGQITSLQFSNQTVQLSFAKVCLKCTTNFDFGTVAQDVEEKELFCNFDQKHSLATSLQVLSCRRVHGEATLR